METKTVRHWRVHIAFKTDDWAVHDSPEPPVLDGRLIVVGPDDEGIQWAYPVENIHSIDWQPIRDEQEEEQ